MLLGVAIGVILLLLISSLRKSNTIDDQTNTIGQLQTENTELREKVTYYSNMEKEFQEKEKDFLSEKEKVRKQLWENCQKYMEHQSIAMPWLAAGMADFLTLQEALVIEQLQCGYNRRNWERSIKINDLKKEKKP